jgi:hypothetical protein
VSHTSANNSPSLTSSLTYKDNNLLDTWTQQGWNDNHSLYDGADRVKYTEYNGAAREYLAYDSSGRREKRYWRFGYNSCATIAALPIPNQNIFDSSRETYTYDGWRLTGSIVRNCHGGNCDTDPASYTRWTNQYTYDAEGNVQTITQTEGTTTRVLTYAWEAGTRHLQSFTRAVNGSVNYSATFEYDRLDRIRAFCKNGASGAACETFSYVGLSDWLSYVKQNGIVTQHYLYANGRPLRYDNLGHYQQPSYYYRYNARGDAAGFVPVDGNGGSGWRVFGAWGDLNYTSEYKGYYNWNAAWGYMAFPKQFNFDAHDVLDVGLYFAHGRRYNQDTGLWLSPWEVGDYLYGGHGQDPVNVGWAFNRPLLTPPLQNGGRTYIHTTYGAIIDTSHFDVEAAAYVIQRVGLGQRVELDHRDLCPVCNPILRIGHTEISVGYGLTPPIADKYGVALAIWMDYERKFETAQPSPPDPIVWPQGASNFSLEDLPTDYLAFWAAADADASGIAINESSIQAQLRKIVGTLGGENFRTEEDCATLFL